MENMSIVKEVLRRNKVNTLKELREKLKKEGKIKGGKQMLNNCNFTGRLTRDVELKYLGNGTPVATFTLAVNRPFKTKDGQDADFINIVVWRKQAENVAQYIGKGSLVAISGRMQSRSYDDKEGRKVYITEVVANEVHFLDSKKTDKTVDTQSNYDTDLKEIEDSEADLPF